MNKYHVPLPQLIQNRFKAHVTRLKASMWKNLLSVDVEIGRGSARFPEEAAALVYEQAVPGRAFAEAGWDSIWFRIDGGQIRSWLNTVKNPESAYLEWIVNGETLLYRGSEPWHGLDTAHLTAPLPPLEDTDQYLYLRCGTYQTGQWMRPGEVTLPPIEQDRLVLYRVRLMERNEFIWDVYHSMEILDQLVEKEMNRWRGEVPAVGHQPPLESVPPLLRRLLAAVDDAVDLYDKREFEKYRKKIDDIYRTFSAAEWENNVAVIGNSHIDLVWLWPESVTEEKTLHTCATMLRLMDRYEDLRFTLTQPEVMQRLKKISPSTYEAMEKRIARGQWEVAGAMEVEGDTLIPCGEGIVRNFLEGQKRFREINGTESEILWLPDAFGFAGCLPQIAAQAGVKFFFTTKLLWSAVNRFPHGSFIWKSPDGSSLVSHLAPIGYEARGSVQEVERIAWSYPQGDVHDESILAIGFGDGGGGVTESQCERVRRLSSLASLPKCRWSRADEFFNRLSEAADRLPIHQGELYLEYHRGTYTTMAQMKVLYREMERTLQVLEAALAVTGEKRNLTRFWERLIFFQFHDALPGSSIDLVYHQIFGEMRTLIDRMNAEIRILLGEDDSNGYTLWNPHGVEGRFCFSLPERTVDRTGGETPCIKDRDGSRLAVQRTADGGYISQICLKGLEARTLMTEYPQNTEESPDLYQAATASELRLSNGAVDAVFCEGGGLESLEINGERMALAAPAGLALYRDQPAQFEAWDIDNSLNWMEIPGIDPIHLEVVEDGPVRAILGGEGSLGMESRFRLEYILEAASPVLRVKLFIDWKEEGQLLRYRIPTSYETSQVRYGAPFGSVERRSFSGEPGTQGYWEVPASRWLGAADGLGRGLGVITRDRYGFFRFDGEIGITLLRSPLSSETNSPGMEGKYLDKGIHTIEFALTSHQERSTELSPSTAQLADLLYTEVVPGRPGGTVPFRVIDQGSLVLSWVKPAEEKGIILRFHETSGSAGRAVLRLEDPAVTKVSTTDLREGNGTLLESRDDGTVAFSYRAYELVSIRVVSGE